MSTQNVLTLSGGRPTVFILNYQSPGDPVPAHTHPASGITSGVFVLARGGSGSDMSTASGFWRQSTSGANVTAGPLAIADIPSGLYPPLAMYWSSAGDIMFVAHTPMRLGLPYLAGSGSGGNLIFYRASGNNQNDFRQVASGHFPISLTYHDVFKVTTLPMSTSGWKSATFPRIS